MVLVADRDIGDYVKRLAERIRVLEQRQGVAAYAPPPGSDFPGGITIGGYPVDTTTTAPTGLVATPGAFLEQIYIDLSWTASATANEYQIEVARKTGPSTYEAPTQYRTSGTAFRVENVLPDSTYGVRVYAINRLGLSSTALPASGYTDVSTSHDAVVPSAITGFTVSAGFRTLVAVWNNSTDFNFDQYQFQIGTAATLDGSGNFTTGRRDTYVGGSIAGFDDLAANTTYYAHVRTISNSGTPGPWTSVASVTTQMIGSAAGQITPLYIDTAVIADGAILTAKIGDGEITDAKIVNLSVSKVLAGTITSKDFILGSGGQIKTAAITPGFVLNNQGFSLYDGSAHRTVYFDGTTGSATFEGTIQASTISGTTIQGGTITGSTIKTAASGRRIEMSNSVENEIRFYTGDALETSPGFVQISSVVAGSANAGRLWIQSPSWSGGAGTTQIGVSYIYAHSGNSSNPALISLGADEGSAGIGAGLDLGTGDWSSGIVGSARLVGQAVRIGAANINNDPYVSGKLELFAGEPSSFWGAPIVGLMSMVSTGDILMTASDDFAIAVTDDFSLTADVAALLTNTTSILGVNYMKLTDGTAVGAGGADLDLAFSGPIYAKTPELAIFGGKLTIYNTGHGIVINGTDAANDCLRGSWGGNGGALGMRTGHSISFEWDGTNIKAYVDNVFIKNL